MQKPNLNRIMTDNLDKAKFQSKFNPSLPTDGWINKYKRGGGMFPEYHSYAPPRMDGGGLLSRKVTCSNCGWSWDAVDGGKDVMTCHKCGGEIKMEQGGMTQYGPGGSIMDGCPPYFTKNAFGVCVNASGQTQQQANAFKQTLNGVKASTTFDGSKYTGNSGTTGVNKVNYSLTPQGKHHEAVINTMKTSPGLSYQQASDRVDITNSSKANPSSMRSLTTAEVEKNKIDQKNEEWRKEHMNWVPGVESENEKTERWKKEDAEHDTDVANTNSAFLAKNNGQAYTFPTENGEGKTVLWKDMDWRQKAYVTGMAQSRDLKLFPNATADETLKTTIDEYNPFPILNRWVKGAATAPYVARETNLYMPYVGAVADPVVTLAAISAGQPELSAGELFTKQLFNWKKPVQTIGKIMTAVEEGELAGFAANKLRKDLIKGGGKDIIKSTQTNVTGSDGTTEQNPTMAEQMKQLKNTPSSQGINQVGLLNPSTLMSVMNGFKSLGVPTSLLTNKYGGTSGRWLDKHI